MSILTSLIKITNIVLLLRNTVTDNRKFVVWKIDDKNPSEVFQSLQITKITTDKKMKLFEHPIETGAVIVDHEIEDPTAVSIEALISIDAQAVLTEIENLYNDGTKLRIRANNRIMENMVINALPEEITSEIFDKTRYSIGFRQALEVSPQYVAMPAAKKKSNTSRINSGRKQTANKTAEQKAKKQSILDRAISGKTQ